MRNTTILTVVLTALFATTSVNAEQSVCVFKNGSKVVVNTNDTTAQYEHYNKAGDVDITLPAVGSFYISNRADINEYIRFQNGEYNYIASLNSFPGSLFEGLRVFKGNKLISTQSCLGGWTSSLSVVNQNLPADPVEISDIFSS